jgi:hypothetical protein
LRSIDQSNAFLCENGQSNLVCSFPSLFSSLNYSFFTFLSPLFSKAIVAKDLVSLKKLLADSSADFNALLDDGKFVKVVEFSL